MEALRKYLESVNTHQTEVPAVIIVSDSLRLLQQAEEEHRRSCGEWVKELAGKQAAIDSLAKTAVECAEEVAKKCVGCERVDDLDAQLATLQEQVREALRLLEGCDCSDGDCLLAEAMQGLRKAVQP